jgi:hypothetical protein
VREREARWWAGLDALLRDRPLSVVKLPSAASAFSSLRPLHHPCYSSEILWCVMMSNAIIVIICFTSLEFRV